MRYRKDVVDCRDNVLEHLPQQKDTASLYDTAMLFIMILWQSKARNTEGGTLGFRNCLKYKLFALVATIELFALLLL